MLNFVNLSFYRLLLLFYNLSIPWDYLLTMLQLFYFLEYTSQTWEIILPKLITLSPLEKMLNYVHSSFFWLLTIFLLIIYLFGSRYHLLFTVVLFFLKFTPQTRESILLEFVTLSPLEKMLNHVHSSFLSTAHCFSFDNLSIWASIPLAYNVAAALFFKIHVPNLGDHSAGACYTNLTWRDVIHCQLVFFPTFGFLF